MDSNELNELNMDIETYKKVKGKLSPEEKKSVTITPDKSSSSMATQMEENLDEVGDKTISDDQLYNLAQQAGYFGEDVKGELIDLMMYGKRIPLSNVKNILSNYDLTLSDLKGKEKTWTPSPEFAHYFTESTNENEVIGPKDPETIKYLSNVIDKNTGDISKPFTISDKKYQMVRGQNQSGEIVMGVYCFDEMGEDGDNIIYPMEYFEENIAKPMKEAMAKEIKEVDKTENSLGLGEFRHYIVNEKTGKFRKFKTIEELARANMGEEERYMTIREFKKFFESRVFGSKKNIVSEINPTGEESDEEMNIKAKKLMDIIKKRVPSNVISTIKTPVARREVIAAFAEMIGVPRTGLAELISGLKDLSKVDAQQSNSLQESKKIIKVKNIKHE
jgi:hypothetical protein